MKAAQPAADEVHHKESELTNEAQPPQRLILPTGPSFQIIQPGGGHKWLGCMPAARGSVVQDVDMEFHLQQATKAFWANNRILLDRGARLGDRLKYFDACVSSVACFASGHRTIHKKQLQTLDAVFRKLSRNIVLPPSGTDWSLEWHEILHAWHERVRMFIAQSQIQTWAVRWCNQYWTLARHISLVFPNCWVRRILVWNPVGRRRVG